MIKYGNGVIESVTGFKAEGLTIDYLPGVLRIHLNDADHTTLEFFCENLKGMQATKNWRPGMDIETMWAGFQDHQEYDPEKHGFVESLLDAKTEVNNDTK